MTLNDLLPRSPQNRPVVCVQGLGFVGRAMAVAIAAARTPSQAPSFDVIGVDLPNDQGRSAITAVNDGRFPGNVRDTELQQRAAEAHSTGNLVATSDPRAFSLADIVVIDVNLDLDDSGGTPSVPLDNLGAAVDTVGRHMQPGTLVIVEVTVPPGTCEKVVAPSLEAALAARDLDPKGYLLAHSYERVMPGADYLHSVINMWRVYSGHTEAAADACERFLSQVVNVSDFPLTRLQSTTASETAKLMENSYRAVNIAFVEEWTRFAEAAGIDLFEVVDAIRVRPTHSNIRFPGFGVGGYCLTKDPLFALAGARQLLNQPEATFPFCELAVQTNRTMPLTSVARLRSELGGLHGKQILLLGAAYRPDIDDTRFSPSETFYREVTGEGAEVDVHDPLVTHWNELDLDLPEALPAAQGYDAVVFAVAHREYRNFDIIAWLGEARPLVLDVNNVLASRDRSVLQSYGCTVRTVGIGEREQLQ